MLVSLALAFAGASEVVRNGIIVAYIPTRQSDIFFTGFNLVAIVALIWTSISKLAAVPAIARQTGDDKRWFFWSTTGTTSVIAVSAIAICLALSGPLSSLIAPGFDAPSRNELSSLLRILLVSMAFIPLSGLAAAALNAEGSYLLPSLERLIRSAVVIVGIVALGSDVDLFSLGILVLGGIALQTATLVPSIWSRGYTFLPLRRAVHPETRVYFKALAILGAGYAVRQLVAIVERALASDEPGGVTVLTLVTQLTVSTSALVSAGLQTVLLTRLAHAKKDGAEEVEKGLNSGLALGVGLVTPMIAIVGALAQPTFEALAPLGYFSEIDPILGRDLSIILCVGLPWTFVGQICSVALYAHEAHHIPTRQLFWNTGINLVLDLALYHTLGLRGLAIGASGAFVINGIWMMIRTRMYLREKYGKASAPRFDVLTVLKILALSAGAATASWGTCELLRGIVSWESWIGGLTVIAVAGAGGMVVAVLGGLALKLEGWNAILLMLFPRRASH